MIEYTPKGKCEDCKKHNSKDCGEAKFFLCASSEYNEGMIYRTNWAPDWWEKKDE